MEFFILIIGSITVIVTTGLIIKNVNDKRRNDIMQKEVAAAKQREKLIKNVIEHGNETDLIALKEQQVVISNEQKLQMLLNAYSASHPSAIQYLKDVDYKLNLTKILEIFLDKKDPAKLQFLLINFLDKQSVFWQAMPPFQPVIAELFSEKDLGVISLLLEIYPANTLRALFLLIEDDKNGKAFQYITRNKSWLQENRSELVSNNVLKDITDSGLINFLLKVFPNGELEMFNLGTLVKSLIDHEIHDHGLYTQLCHQMNGARLLTHGGSLAGNINTLKDIIQYSIFKDRLDVFELIIQSNRIFLSENTKESNEIIRSFVFQNQKISEIFFRNGINVNSNMPDNVSIVERSIVDNAKTNEQNQLILDMLLTYGLDLNTKMSEINKPNKIDEITLLGFLVFTGLIIKDNPDFDALKLQKLIAMFFDIPGTSRSNGTLCVHEYMREPYAHWNDLLDLYFKNLNTASLDTELNQCIDRLHSLDGTYDPQSTYDMYNQGKPIVLPVNLRGYWGEAHIATVGFIKIDDCYHLRIEADRGLGRKDFSIIKEPVFNSPYTLSQYTNNRNCPLPLEESWQTGPTKTKNYILTIPIGEQKSSSCPSTSAKYAFHIAYFLCEIHNRNFSFALGINDQKALLNEVYQSSDHWFKDFLTSTQQLLLQKYQGLDPKYIDIDFLAKIEQESIIKQEEIDNPSALRK